MYAITGFELWSWRGTLFSSGKGLFYGVVLGLYKGHHGKSREHLRNCCKCCGLIFSDAIKYNRHSLNLSFFLCNIFRSRPSPVSPNPLHQSRKLPASHRRPDRHPSKRSPRGDPSLRRLPNKRRQRRYSITSRRWSKEVGKRKTRDLWIITVSSIF